MSLSSLCTLPRWPLCPLGRRAHRLETTALVYFSENISTASWTEDAASCHSPSLKELQTASRSSVSFLLWNIYFSALFHILYCLDFIIFSIFKIWSFIKIIFLTFLPATNILSLLLLYIATEKPFQLLH